MPGINLSHASEQSVELKKYDSFGRGALSIALILIFSVAAWGGIVYYEKKLTAEIGTISDKIAEKQGAFSSADVDGVADFKFRIDILKAELSEERVSPARLLGSIEELLLPGIRLSSYSFSSNEAGRTVSLIGEADSLGTVAKQMVIIKRMPGFSSVLVDSLSREENGTFKVGISMVILP